MRRIRTAWLASALLGLTISIPSVALATTFQSISVAPPDPIPAGSSIWLTVNGSTTGGPGYNYTPTAVSIVGNSIDVTLDLTTDCAIASGICPLVEIGYSEQVSLGVLAPGTYDLDVEMRFTSASPTYPFPVAYSVGTMSTVFTVVPEPGTALLLWVGLAALSQTRRR